MMVLLVGVGVLYLVLACLELAAEAWQSVRPRCQLCGAPFGTTERRMKKTGPIPRYQRHWRCHIRFLRDPMVRSQLETGRQVWRRFMRVSLVGFAILLGIGLSHAFGGPRLGMPALAQAFLAFLSLGFTGELIARKLTVWIYRRRSRGRYG